MCANPTRALPSIHSAGRDTTAQTLTWQFYSLLTNPRVMNNLLREIEIVLNGSQSYTYEVMMQDLPYLKAVFHETLRLFPPGKRGISMNLHGEVEGY